MKLLRFFTCGNVDDGKSTLIGRLLLDSGSISTDIIETLTRQSKAKSPDSEIDLALLTDGLRAEREQGITIDVAYKFFSTEKRKFITADTPGHVQYTRNMVTGASSAELAIILIDARNGITEQTQRHSVISALLGLPEVIVCVNKMDMVGFDQKVFEAICAEYTAFSRAIGIRHLTFIPVSALAGDNVVETSVRMPWYSGPTLLSYLETVEPEGKQSFPHPRFDVQWVIRPQTAEFHDYRGLAGTLLSGELRVGQPIVLLPAGLHTTVAGLEKNGVPTMLLCPGEPGVVLTADAADASRGTMICGTENLPDSLSEFSATLCWMDETGPAEGEKFLLRQNAFSTKAVIAEVTAHINIRDRSDLPPDGMPGLNDLFKAVIRTALPVSADRYTANRKTGGFILVSERTNNTVAAGMVD